MAIDLPLFTPCAYVLLGHMDDMVGSHSLWTYLFRPVENHIERAHTHSKALHAWSLSAPYSSIRCPMYGDIPPWKHCCIWSMMQHSVNLHMKSEVGIVEALYTSVGPLLWFHIESSCNTTICMSSSSDSLSGKLWSSVTRTAIVLNNCYVILHYTPVWLIMASP